MKTLYKVLEVSEHASTDEIKASYRRLVKRTHPDNSHADLQLQEAFLQINQAYKILSTEKKADYDKGLRNARKQKWKSAFKVSSVFLSLFLLVYLLLKETRSTDTLAAKEVSQATVPMATKAIIQENKQPISVSKVFSNRDTVADKTFDRNTSVKTNGLENDRVVISSHSYIGKNVVEKKQLSEPEMQQILAAVVSEKSQSGNFYNCVQIRKSKNSNIKNWESISELMRHNGFIISGREVVNSKVDGIDIDTSGQCLIITVGFLSDLPLDVR